MSVGVATGDATSGDNMTPTTPYTLAPNTQPANITPAPTSPSTPSTSTTANSRHSHGQSHNQVHSPALSTPALSPTDNSPQIAKASNHRQSHRRGTSGDGGGGGGGGDGDRGACVGNDSGGAWAGLAEQTRLTSLTLALVTGAVASDGKDSDGLADLTRIVEATTSRT